MNTPPFQQLPLSRARAPFSHPDWLFETKGDGFRALLYSGADGVRLVSRNGNTLKSSPGVSAGLTRDLRSRRCVLDSEIVCLVALVVSPVVYNGQMPISARNKLGGQIEEIRLGDVMAHVVVRVGDNLIESAITRRSADELKLKKAIQ
jgi:molybdopterin-binding protein